MGRREEERNKTMRIDKRRKVESKWGREGRGEDEIREGIRREGQKEE